MTNRDYLQRSYFGWMYGSLMLVMIAGMRFAPLPPYSQKVRFSLGVLATGAVLSLIGATVGHTVARMRCKCPRCRVNLWRALQAREAECPHCGLPMDVPSEKSGTSA